MNAQQIQTVLKLRIGYCVSCQNLFCSRPELRKKSNGNCSDWSQPDISKGTQS